MDMTIEEFCDLHNACYKGRCWALANCRSMRDAWDKLPSEWLIWVATQRGVLTDKELRLFAVHCARYVRHLKEDDRSVGVADDEMASAARAAERAVTWAAAKAALGAASALGEATTEAEAADAAWSAARAAAGAVMDDFAAYLRSNTSPVFTRPA